MSNSSHRNIKLLGGDLIAFTFNLLVYNFLFLKQLFSFLWSMFSVVKTVSTNSDDLTLYKNGRLTD